MARQSRASDSSSEALKFITKCPLCNEAYDPSRAHFFGKTDRATLVHITCLNCQSYFMAMVVMMGHGLSSVGMITDLSLSDAERLYQAPPVTLDEALKAVEEMENPSFISHFIS